MSLLAALLLATAAEPSSLERLADQLAAEVQRAEPEAPVAIAVRADSPEGAQAFATLLAGRLTAERLAGIVVAPGNAEAEARSAGARSLLRISLSPGRDVLEARGDLFGLWRSFWAGAAPVRPPSPAAALVERTPLDAQAIALFHLAQPAEENHPPALVARVLAQLDGPPAAVAAGDLTGDGRDEVIALTDHEVAVFDLEGALLAQSSIDELPFADAPCRDPFGALTVLSSPPRIAAFNASRAQGQLLQLDTNQHALVELERIDRPLLGRDPLTFAARFVPGENRFAQATLPGRLGSSHGVFQAISVESAGKEPEALVISPEGDAVHARKRHPELLHGLGAASALVDLDGDGKAEILTTDPARFPLHEAARVLGQDALTVPLTGRAVAATAVRLAPSGKEIAVIAVELPDGKGELVAVEETR